MLMVYVREAPLDRPESGDAKKLCGANGAAQPAQTEA